MSVESPNSTLTANLSFPKLEGHRRLLDPGAFVLRKEDLRKLFELVEKYTDEEAVRFLKQLNTDGKVTHDQLQPLLDQRRVALGLLVEIQGATGFWSASPSADSLDRLPDVLRRVELNSEPFYRQHGIVPANRVRIVFDFSEPRLGDLSNANESPGPSTLVEVAGANATWVNGLAQELTDFFAVRRSHRSFLYYHNVYELLLLVVGLPLFFRVLLLMQGNIERLTTRWPGVLTACLYIYLGLIALNLFRLLFNYARWAFPKIEHEGLTTQRPFHRGIVGMIGAALLSIVVQWVVALLAR